MGTLMKADARNLDAATARLASLAGWAAERTSFGRSIRMLRPPVVIHAARISSQKALLLNFAAPARCKQITGQSDIGGLGRSPW